jgi:hypothetical protein
VRGTSLGFSEQAANPNTASANKKTYGVMQEEFMMQMYYVELRFDDV